MRIEAERVDQHEHHVDRGARADGGDDRDALARRDHEPPRLDIERAHQFALGEADEVAAVDDVGAMAFEPGAGAGQPRDAPGEREQVVDQRAAAVAVVAFDHGERALAERLHRGEPRQADDLAEHHHQQRQAGEDRQHQSDRAKPGRARIQDPRPGS